MRTNWPRLLTVLVLIGAAGLLAACSGGSNTPTPIAAQPPTPLIQGPALAFDKEWVSLGTVRRDHYGVQTFLVINPGSEPLSVGPLSIQVQEGCDTAETVTGSIGLQGQEMALLPVRFGQHTQLGHHRLLINVESTDPSRPRATLTLEFDVTEDPPEPTSGPRLKVDKEMVDIGTVPNDWPLYEQFTLRNVGDAPLILKDTLPPVQVVEGC